MDAGATGIELDVHAARDGGLFVYHDAAIGSQEHPIPFTDLDSSDVAKVRLEGDVRIPTLDEALTAIGSRADAYIEIKATGIEQDVARCLRRHMANSERHAVHSFDHRIVKRMLELIPSVRTGMLQVSYLLDTVGAMRRTGASDLWQHADFIDAALVTDVHSSGGRIIAWTPNTGSRWESLAAIGVDGICTDDIAGFAGWRQGRS